MNDHNKILDYNRDAWNQQVASGNRWTVPVTSEQVDAARRGDWQIVLTPIKPVPKSWFPDFSSGTVKVLCLAGGGGQQGPILAAAGANVTVFDNSDAQLQQDIAVAQRDNLKIATEQGDMANLSAFADNTFDLIFHPCSNCFVPDVRPVWKEAFRVLKPGGNLLSGFTNPVRYLFDDELLEKGTMKVLYKIPYSDLTSISDELKQRYESINEPRCFGHTLADQIGGQTAAGFAVTGFFEDKYESDDVLSQHINTFIATKATKPAL
jgi:SAM-dependent methyltransferase